jgi:hypothetical protein
MAKEGTGTKGWPEQTEGCVMHIEGIDTCCVKNTVPHDPEYDPVPVPSRVRMFVNDEFTFVFPKKGNCL